MNIYPTNLHISNNSNDLNFNNFIKIKNNDVSIATSYNSKNIITISDIFHIMGRVSLKIRCPYKE